MNKLLTKTDAVKLPTRLGQFSMLAYYDAFHPDAEPTVVLLKGNVHNRSDVLVRFHSECLTGEVFGSLRCDCGEQLEKAMRMIGESRMGIIIYLRQEGRGIGLVNKLRAYHLQDMGYDTVTANEKLELPIDNRDYTLCRFILDDLRVHSIRIMTNNPDKVRQATELGINVSGVVPLEVEPHPENLKYLSTKKRKMGHLLTCV
ncbi:MAG: GTP cyclohydrolase II [Alicyclobacillus sp.]|uniref:GTP cyclohydrolase II n=1 Tax=Alicyclobacillus herbarius TaxID=122960 RepID=UPI0006853C3F|nr:GTP cyclohydrolase II [Alicyclobacillus herbarius]MCL6446201.1 GTP cyclohydrolase II [Alicyclobacillus sp.]